MENVFLKIAEVIADTKGLEVNDITPESTLESLSIDSLDVAEMCMTLEDEFGVKLTGDVIRGFETVGDIVALMQ